MGKGSGYLGSSEVINSGNGEYEIVPQLPNKEYFFYKFEFIGLEEKEVVIKINNGQEICLWNGYFSIDKNDAEIYSFIVVSPKVDFYWYGAY